MFEKATRAYHSIFKVRGTPRVVLVTGGGILLSYLTAIVADAERQKREKKSRAHNWWDYPCKGKGPFYRWWDSQRESEKTLWGIIALNGAVFLGWKNHKWHHFMLKYFSNSTKSSPLTLGTSIFSHCSGMHFTVNMIALYSFGRYVHDRMGREQFLAFYFSSGLFSSAASHIWRSFRNDFSHSLGASGAIFAVAGASAHNPDLRVSLIFVPFFSLPISTALPILMAFDAIGMFRGWKRFDHAAHLSGALGGYVGYALSAKNLWPHRRKILKRLGYPV